ncbi:MAG TPA: hypothetical protein VF469_29560, partial [Kofleriaceae bacterium]
MLIALAARLDAAPGGDPLDLAIRYADVLSGAGADAARASDGDEDDEADDEADEAAERAAELEDQEAGDGDGDGATDRDQVEPTGELAGLDLAPGDASEDPLVDTDLGTPASL